MKQKKDEGGRDVCAHKCKPIEGNTITHWAESDWNGWTVLDDERDQRQAQGTRKGPSKRR